MEWQYLGRKFTDPDSGHLGFVYIIRNHISDRSYIGKKLFLFSKTKMVKGKKKRFKQESDWRDYWSSSDELKADITLLGKENFTREILHLCETKGMCNYLEAREQMDRRVLESAKWYNHQIMARVHRSHVNPDKLIQK